MFSSFEMRLLEKKPSNSYWNPRDLPNATAAAVTNHGPFAHYTYFPENLLEDSAPD